ncbi:hypothetical protein HP439_11230 [Sphingobacterium shayense]|uniref:hypothetical protein n=1 Tax=Sphingobacterium shayense TaxID=626343 RepID=UPI001554EAEC|nr:hypothetical protein [Sphingobacterium shayense]NQD71292.1 hypothetical protein [Sphingobacterium shayense]
MKGIFTQSTILEFVMCLVGNGIAQHVSQTISGVVKDITESPIEEATLSTKDSMTSTKVSGDSQLTLPITIGNNVFTVSMIGYLLCEVPIDVAQNRAHEPQISLGESTWKFGEVIVSASRLMAAFAQKSSSVTTLNQRYRIYQQEVYRYK